MLLGVVTEPVGVIIPLVSSLMGDNQLVFWISQLTHQLNGMFDAFSLNYPGGLQNEDVILLETNFSTKFKVIIMIYLWWILEIQHVGDDDG